VFSATYCPHCKNTQKSLLDQGIGAYVVEVDTLSNEQEVREFLNDKTGLKTFPKNFINGQMVGGNSDLFMMMRNGQFDEMINPTSKKEEVKEAE